MPPLLPGMGPPGQALPGADSPAMPMMPLPGLDRPPMPPGGPISSPTPDVDDRVARLVSSMSIMAARKALVPVLINEAVDKLKQAREIDPKLEGPLSQAIAAIKGSEDVGAGSPREGGSLSRRSY